ncbi:hypothetical protein [Roseobacter fucihabitans]
MTSDTTPNPPQRRGDLLVSVCFVSDRPGDISLEALRQSEQMLKAQFRYWEILIIIEATDTTAYDRLFAHVENIRLLRVRARLSSYRARVLAAMEAIGDVVLITTPDDAGAVDLFGMILSAHEQASIIVARRQTASFIDPVLRAIGKTGGFRVSTRNLQTIAFPRPLLSVLLNHPDREIALRFPPRDVAIPVLFEDVRAPINGRGIRHFGKRLQLLQKLSVAIAPRVLNSIALISGLVILSGLIFAIYAISVWLVLEDVQPGWLTISLMLSFTAIFLGLSVFGISIGLQKVINMLSPHRDDGIIDEQSSVDLFSEVMTELNIENTASDAPLNSSKTP